MFETKAAMRRMAEEAHRLKKKVASIKEETSEAIGTVKQTLEVGAATFGFAYAGQLWADDNGDFTIAGAPVDLAAAVVLHGLAFFGATGKKYAEDAHNFGDGALASWLAKKGAALGKAAKEEGGFFKQVGISGIPNAPGHRQEVPIHR